LELFKEFASKETNPIFYTYDSKKKNNEDMSINPYLQSSYFENHGMSMDDYDWDEKIRDEDNEKELFRDEEEDDERKRKRLWIDNNSDDLNEYIIMNDKDDVPKSSSSRSSRCSDDQAAVSPSCFSYFEQKPADLLSISSGSSYYNDDILKSPFKQGPLQRKLSVKTLFSPQSHRTLSSSSPCINGNIHFSPNYYSSPLNTFVGSPFADMIDVGGGFSSPVNSPDFIYMNLEKKKVSTRSISSEVRQPDTAFDVTSSPISHSDYFNSNKKSFL
jgi:hypothetical protein